MKKMLKNISETRFVHVFLAVIIIAVAAVFIGNAIARAKTPKFTPVSEDKLPETVEVPDYEELYSDRNVDETQIIVTIREGVDPYYRSDPVIDGSTVVGTLKAGQSLNVQHVYAVTTENEGKILWVGVKSAELQRQADFRQEKTTKSNSDQIVWINGAYATAYLRDHNPGSYGETGDYYVRYEKGFSKYRIIVSDCALRATPQTGGDSNVYGRFKETSYIYTNIVYENKTNTFYGVPATAIDVRDLEDRVGDPENDPDGIVWFSVEYLDGEIVEI